jgi:soluble lytic murein transglycosylase-like protein
MVRFLFIMIALAAPASAAPELCERAAAQAAAETGVPADLLLAIALAESGRQQDGRLRPWPWAANLEGQGHWFDTRAELVAFAEGAVAVGRPSVDIGCFQINWRWHGQHFARPGELSDPLTGARHAAGYLARLHAEFGGWEAAVGAYHSRDPARAQRYAARVASLRGTAPTAPPAPHPPPDPPVRVAWALDGGGPPAAPGSIVPSTAAPRPFLDGLAP